MIELSKGGSVSQASWHQDRIYGIDPIHIATASPYTPCKLVVPYETGLTDGVQVWLGDGNLEIFNVCKIVHGAGRLVELRKT